MAKFGSFYRPANRKKRSWAWLFSSILLLVLSAAADTRWGLTPPLARFLSPYEGVWQVTRQAFHQPGTYTLRGRDGSISIRLDEDLVPHIEATSSRDLFFAQGFITARHRLWQMEFQILAAAGRLSEIIGEKTLEMDRYQRRFGIPEAARRTAKVMMADPETAGILLAYTEGVNQAIREWPERELPLEYKLLDYQPGEWTPESTALLLKSMAYTLSGYSDDRALDRALDRYGKPVIDQLFPGHIYEEEPIIPRGTSFGFRPLPVPKIPASLGWTDTTDERIPLEGQPRLEDDNAVGSNNWAVDGRHSATGYPLLANDPHLKLNLPSIWYMAELKGPGIHVMGASLPGAPCIISGFNAHFSWGTTNGYPDVTDWFQVNFKDADRKQYWYRGGWRNIRKQIETIGIRGQEPFRDTVYWTEAGPLVYRRGEKTREEFVPPGHALRWVAHDPGNELKTFFRLNICRKVAEAPAALQYYNSPAQNFATADGEGNIGMFAQQGRIPLRWKDQGKFLLLAGSEDQLWQGFIPRSHLPREINPARGYVSSANQIPADTLYPYYLNWNYYNPERGKRINALLAQTTRHTPASFKAIQNDNHNLFAEAVLPGMLKAVQNRTDRPRWFTEALAKWNFRHDASETGPALFEEWFSQWMTLVWSDDFGPGMRFPDKHVTWRIFLEKDNSSWFDLRQTPATETGSELWYRALLGAADSLQARLGPYRSNPGAYAWGKVKATRIDHIGRIPGLGSGVLEMGGGKGIVNATSTQTGSSWKMIVSMGPRPRALVIYPGGQSGNPASPYYTHFLEAWKNGQYREMRFP